MQLWWLGPCGLVWNKECILLGFYGDDLPFSSKLRDVLEFGFRQADSSF